MKFSKKTQGFYPSDIEYPTLPDDCIDISDEDYQIALARPPMTEIDYDYDDNRLLLINKIDIEQQKIEAIATVEAVANQYHAELVGTSDPLKAKRYEQNVLHARAITNNAASDAVIAAMQAQLDANKAVNPTVFAVMDLKAFCEWILGLASLSEVAAPYIETIRITGRAMINAATDQAGIEAALEQLKVMAQAKFNELMQSQSA